MRNLRHPYPHLRDRAAALLASVLIVLALAALTALTSGCKKGGGGDYFASHRFYRQWRPERADAGLSVLVWVSPNDARGESILSALRTWEDATQGRARFRVLRPSVEEFTDPHFIRPAADVTVEFRGLGGPEGWASIRPEAGDAGARFDFIGTATILLDPMDPSADTPRELEAVAAHEVGHALGLAHSPRVGDLMMGSNRGRPTRPTSRDLMTLRRLYDEVDIAARTVGGGQKKGARD